LALERITFAAAFRFLVDMGCLRSKIELEAERYFIGNIHKKE
jgi:hypothetical protein